MRLGVCNCTKRQHYAGGNMRPKSLALLALALGCGLAASIGISQVMDANSRGSAGNLDTTPIYIALTNINLGDPINAEMIALEEWPANKVPPGAIGKIETLEGRRARTTIIAGTPILEPQLLAMGELADPVANIPDGFRLSTISVNAEKSAAGLLSPGDRVDVQLFVEANQRQGINQSKTRLILENVRVFAVEQAVQRAAEGDESRAVPKTVSLLVKPEQASKIDLAQNLGELSLIPRNPNDEGSSGHNEITAADLLGEGSMVNSRSTERGGEVVEQKPSLLGGIINMMKQSTEPRATFKMEIVEAGSVRDVRFDATTGEVLSDEQRVSATTASTTQSQTGGDQSSTSAEPQTPHSPTGRDDSEEMEDFPIDFE